MYVLYMYKYERKASYDVDKVYRETRVGTYGSWKWHTLRKGNKSSLFSVYLVVVACWMLVGELIKVHELVPNTMTRNEYVLINKKTKA